MFGCDKGFCHFPLSPAVHCRSGVSTQTRWWQRGVSTRLLAARMARTQVGGKWKGPRDPTKEARIQPAIRDTLTGVHGSFHSAAIAHNVSTPSTILSQLNFPSGTPTDCEIVRQANTILDARYSMNIKKQYWWTGATITRIQQPLYILESSALKYWRW